MSDTTKTLLLILDGWGIAAAGTGNGVASAETPNLDRIQSTYPSGRLLCSGRAVGLPDGFMGNSEVGHMNIGAGRVVYQDMTRIDISIEEGTFGDNPVLTELFDAVKKKGGRLHLMGLVSDGGVHSHQNHISAILDAAQQHGVEDVCIHAFLDGRDTPPTSGAGYVRQLVETCEHKGVGRIASITGRFWAMDRDKRWDRNEQAYNMLFHGQGEAVSDPVAAVEAAYKDGENDEFVKPRVVTDGDDPVGVIRDGDGIFFFNFRADRARQISQAIFDDGFSEFERGKRPDLAGFATMTRYESTFPMPAAFPPESYDGTLGEAVSGMGLKQLRIAETEKYAHVTYFLNCGREEPFAGEDRIMVPSPREVPTYDLKPQMSAEEVTDKLLAALPEYDLLVCNLANLDMVGHTGIIPAVITAVQTVDACVGRIVEAVLAQGGRILLTADHGNAEEMIDAAGGPQTAHSKNPVPLVYISDDAGQYAVSDGKLGDIAPSILALWDAPRPEAMTGTPLVVKKQA